MTEKPGPSGGQAHRTGEFPEGPMYEIDEGEIKIMIAAEPRNQVVVIDFGKPVPWLAIPSKVARKFAAQLIAKANQLDRGLGRGGGEP